jgi:hypothetical protein
MAQVPLVAVVLLSVEVHLTAGVPAGPGVLVG